MALYNQLPVYKTSYDLLVQIFHQSRHFSKEYKYTIGESLKNETVAMIANIYRANSRQEKVLLIQQARENVEVIRLYLRLVKDLQQINIPVFVALNELIESVSKQLTAWKNPVLPASVDRATVLSSVHIKSRNLLVFFYARFKEMVLIAQWSKPQLE